MFENTNRRRFLQRSAQAGLGLAGLGALSPAVSLADDRRAQLAKIPKGKAEHCIMIWLGGGSCHIDTFDAKRRGNPKKKEAGSYYDPIDTAVADTQVCEHLPKCAAIMDRFNLLRTVHHDVIDEHAAATNRMHTGRPTSGTVVYPSIGSVMARQRGPANEQAPAYVLIGYPNVTRGPGFLGAESSYVYLTDTESGPAGFSRPASISARRQSRREQLLARTRAEYLRRTTGGRTIADYDATVSEAMRLSGPQFMNVFQLNREAADLRQAYGGEFGQRCLLSRRLLQAGVRFVEVSHNLNFINGTGWDTHNAGILNQHLLIRELDQALSALVLDLERQKLLDKTLIMVASEFGRPAGFDGGGGRGHYAKCFTVALAGGGLQNGKTIGTTDELGMKTVDRPVSVPDWHATAYWALGIDPTEELYTPDDRPVPITDGGMPVVELFA